jgi:hypothetical protein
LTLQIRLYWPLIKYSDTLIRHRKVHGKSNGAPEARNGYGGASSTARVDAAATPVNLQSLTGHQNNTQNVPTSGDMPYSGYDNNNVNAADVPPMNPSLQDGHSREVVNNLNVGFSDDLLDPQLQQYSQDPQSNSFPFSPQIDLWNLQNESFPSWHVGDDFDLEAFNMYLRSPSLVDQFPWHAEATAAEDGNHATIRIEAQGPSAPSMEDIQGLWITKADNYSWKNDGNHSYSVAPTQPITPITDSPSGNTVDERYWEDLSLKLRPHWKEDTLPSTEFLVSVSTLFEY